MCRSISWATASGKGVLSFVGWYRFVLQLLDSSFAPCGYHAAVGGVDKCLRSVC